MKKSKTTLILGGQWGDEGKGKIVDVLSEKADQVVRYSGGNNAGHTIVVGKEVYKLHLLPSGVVRKKRSLIGCGVVLDPAFLLMEIDRMKSRGLDVTPFLGIDPRTHIIMPWHQLMDEARENAKGKNQIGTTKKGIGPCYEDKCSREGIRFEELIDPKALQAKIDILYPVKVAILKDVYGLKKVPTKTSILSSYIDYGKRLKKLVTSVTDEIVSAMSKGKSIVFEGAQGILLDNALGTYPFVTSSSPGLAGVGAGSGIAPTLLTNVEPVIKAYTTRVGNGPFPTELPLEQTNPKETYTLEGFADDKKHASKASILGEFLRRQGYEFGTTTGRPRRCGWLDLVLVHTGKIWNGYTGLHITKLDVLAGLKEIKVCVAYSVRGKKVTTVPASTADFLATKPVYETFPGFKNLSAKEWSAVVKEGKRKGFKSLPKEAYNYIKMIEKKTGIPILSVSVGPSRDAIIFAR
jgi:adenylosuccinate synthase